MTVYFRCKNCDEEHRSPIQMDKKSWEDPNHIFHDNSLQCPKTIKSALYSKKDTFWKD